MLVTVHCYVTDAISTGKTHSLIAASYEQQNWKSVMYSSGTHCGAALYVW